MSHSALPMLWAVSAIVSFIPFFSMMIGRSVTSLSRGGGGNSLWPYSQQRPMRPNLSCCLDLIDNGQHCCLGCNNALRSSFWHKDLRSVFAVDQNVLSKRPKRYDTIGLIGLGCLAVHVVLFAAPHVIRMVDHPVMEPGSIYSIIYRLSTFRAVTPLPHLSKPSKMCLVLMLSSAWRPDHHWVVMAEQ